ncbi:hypothetical protein RUM44_005920 [Polyplax serrata]|uniref:dolichol kinase n=1 Tax=Polyplax serrata TaxID=468196 RepID=A0ABR1AYF2_POLSC
MEEIGQRVQRVLQASRITPRASGSPGIWLSFLLPTAVIIGCSNNFRRSLCYTITNALIYFEGVPLLLKVFPNAFTFGEVNLAVQGLSLFIYSVFLTLNFTLAEGIPHNEIDVSSVILLLVLSWVLVFCVVPFIHRTLKQVQAIYVLGFSVAVMIYFSVLYNLDLNIFTWIWLFLIKPERIILLSIWLVCTALAVFIVQHHINIRKKSNTAVRKYFHVLIVAVFVPGILTDTNLLYFSSGCVLGLFGVLEVFRILNIPPLHTFLREGFTIYCDEKDAGGLALTPICLLIGNSLPLWLHPQKVHTKETFLPLMSGILSVGVGDTCASVGGKYLGKHKWKGSIKTIEGTLFCILSQVIFMQCLLWFSFLELTTEECLKCVIAICITALVEAKTDQIDNIVLPLTMYILLML